jgi:hypothetical protein
MMEEKGQTKKVNQPKEKTVNFVRILLLQITFRKRINIVEREFINEKNPSTGLNYNI